MCWGSEGQEGAVWALSGTMRCEGKMREARQGRVSSQVGMMSAGGNAPRGKAREEWLSDYAV